MKLGLSARTRTAAQAGMKLAKLLELPERGAEDRLKELEADPLFRKLAAAGVLRLESDGIRFAARGASGLALRADPGLEQGVDPSLAGLIEEIGREAFTECFLDADNRFDDAERARRCGITKEQARRLRDLVDKLYVQAELQTPAPSAEPAPAVCSPVAGIAIEDGKPFIAFFHRDLWKGRYRVDDRRRDQLAGSLTQAERRRLDALLLELEQLERRKSTLRKVLELVVETQAEYLVRRDLSRRTPLTQRALAAAVGSDPSVINRLLAGKSVELPWGLEAPLRSFVPSRKTILLDRLQEIMEERPGVTDEVLRAELEKRCGAKLSRRSVTQYRVELGR